MREVDGFFGDASETAGQLESASRPWAGEARCLLPGTEMLSDGTARPAYLTRAVLSFWHFFWLVLFLTLTAGIASRWGVPAILLSALAVLACDAVCVGITSRLEGFRQKVDLRLAEVARRAAAQARSDLLRKMSSEHVHELLRLESLVDGMRHPHRAGAAPVQAVRDACGALLASYVRLAIRHRSGALCLSCVDREQLDQEISTLERAPCADWVRPHLQRRITVSRQRALRWEATRERLGPLEDQLRMIGERIRLAVEQMSAVPAALCGEQHVRVATLDEEEMELVRVEEEVDPDVMVLGRSSQGE